MSAPITMIISSVLMVFRGSYSRYLKKVVWMDFFNKLLNIPDCDDLPNLQELKAAIDQEVYAMDSELQKHIRTLTNLLFKR